MRHYFSRDPLDKKNNSISKFHLHFDTRLNHHPLFPFTTTYWSSDLSHHVGRRSRGSSCLTFLTKTLLTCLNRSCVELPLRWYIWVVCMDPESLPIRKQKIRGQDGNQILVRRVRERWKIHSCLRINVFVRDSTRNDESGVVRRLWKRK